MGYPVVFVERQLYLETVMKHLSEDGKKNRIHTSASVADVEQDNEGVTVTTVDGRSFRGDILIGADGVHSKVRDLISMELQKGKLNFLSTDTATDIPHGKRPQG